MSSRYFIYKLLFLSPLLQYPSPRKLNQNHKKVIKNLSFPCLTSVHSSFFALTGFANQKDSNKPLSYFTFFFSYLASRDFINLLTLCWWMERTKINCFLLSVQLRLCYEMLLIRRMWLIVYWMGFFVILFIMRLNWIANWKGTGCPSLTLLCEMFSWRSIFLKLIMQIIWFRHYQTPLIEIEIYRSTFRRASSDMISIENLWGGNFNIDWNC